MVTTTPKVHITINVVSGNKHTYAPLSQLPKHQNMKKCFLLLILLLFIKSGWSQNPNLDYKKALKVYNLTTYEDYSKSKNDTTRFTSTTLQILHPTFAFQWKSKKNNFHEIELTDFHLAKARTKTEITKNLSDNGQLLSGNDLVTTSISVRYDYIINFCKSKDKKLVPSLGFGINPYFRLNKYVPTLSTSFPATEQFFGVRAFFTPRLTYYLTSKLFIDINIPLCVFDYYNLTDKVNNPSLTLNEQKNYSSSFETSPRIFSGRIGIGLKI